MNHSQPFRVSRVVRGAGERGRMTPVLLALATHSNERAYWVQYPS
jgi:hypothetical protein